MFTGIIQAVGTVAEVASAGRMATMRIHAPALDRGDVAPGDSIAINGVCLTVTKLDTDGFSFDVSPETLAVTAGFRAGDAVNLEKSLRLADRLGGHLVSGHVDAVGEVAAVERVDGNWIVTVRYPPQLSRYFARKGSVTLNGVSLTVNAVADDTFSLNLIPHTLAVTNLNALAAGSRVNLEVDLVARYVERMLNHEGGNP
jgi:riboflavin synthase